MNNLYTGLQRFGGRFVWFIVFLTKRIIIENLLNIKREKLKLLKMKNDN
jgi:hypothetical protein